MCPLQPHTLMGAALHALVGVHTPGLLQSLKQKTPTSPASALKPAQSSFLVQLVTTDASPALPELASLSVPALASSVPGVPLSVPLLGAPGGEVVPLSLCALPLS